MDLVDRGPMRKKYRTLREIQRTLKAEIGGLNLVLALLCANLATSSYKPWVVAIHLVVIGVILFQIARNWGQIKGIDLSRLTKIGWATLGYGSLIIAWLAKPELPLAKKCDSRDAIRRLLPEEEAEFLAWFTQLESTLERKGVRLADYPLDSIVGAFVRGTSPEDFVAGEWKKLSLVSGAEFEAALEARTQTGGPVLSPQAIARDDDPLGPPPS